MDGDAMDAQQLTPAVAPAGGKAPSDGSAAADEMQVDGEQSENMQITQPAAVVAVAREPSARLRFDDNYALTLDMTVKDVVGVYVHATKARVKHNIAKRTLAEQGIVSFRDKIKPKVVELANRCEEARAELNKAKIAIDGAHADAAADDGESDEKAVPAADAAADDDESDEKAVPAADAAADDDESDEKARSPVSHRQHRRDQGIYRPELQLQSDSDSESNPVGAILSAGLPRAEEKQAEEKQAEEKQAPAEVAALMESMGGTKPVEKWMEAGCLDASNAARAIVSDYKATCEATRQDLEQVMAASISAATSPCAEIEKAIRQTNTAALAVKARIVDFDVNVVTGAINFTLAALLAALQGRASAAIYLRTYLRSKHNELLQSEITWPAIVARLADYTAHLQREALIKRCELEGKASDEEQQQCLAEVCSFANMLGAANKEQDLMARALAVNTAKPSKQKSKKKSKQKSRKNDTSNRNEKQRLSSKDYVSAATGLTYHQIDGLLKYHKLALKLPYMIYSGLAYSTPQKQFTDYEEALRLVGIKKGLSMRRQPAESCKVCGCVVTTASNACMPCSERLSRALPDGGVPEDAKMLAYYRMISPPEYAPLRATAAAAAAAAAHDEQPSGGADRELSEDAAARMMLELRTQRTVFFGDAILVQRVAVGAK